MLYDRNKEIIRNVAYVICGTCTDWDFNRNSIGNNSNYQGN